MITAFLQGATATALAFTPAAVLAIFPFFTGVYDGMISNSKQGQLDKNAAGNGKHVDINSHVPHYSVYLG